jgi:hypothetical protein
MVIQKTPDLIGPAVWLSAGKILQWGDCIYSVTGYACSVKGFASPFYGLRKYSSTLLK